MKISKTAWLILGIGIFVIVLASLGWVYLGQRSEQRELNDSLSAAETSLDKLVSEEEDWESQLSQLESRLTQATSLLNAVKASYTNSVESIEVDEKLFMIADSWRLEVTSLTSSEPTQDKVEDVTYSVTSFTVGIAGEVVDILGFTNTIANDEYFNNATVELVDVSVPEPKTGDEEEEQPSASINLVFYSYQGEGE